MIAARRCRHEAKDSPYSELVKTVSDHEGNTSDLTLADAFFELGSGLKDEQLFKQAATAYENAVFLLSVEDGEFHRAAFDELIRSRAPRCARRRPNSGTVNMRVT